jgi:hypothetical protein
MVQKFYFLNCQPGFEPYLFIATFTQECPNDLATAADPKLALDLGYYLDSCIVFQQGLVCFIGGKGFGGFEPRPEQKMLVRSHQNFQIVQKFQKFF